MESLRDHLFRDQTLAITASLSITTTIKLYSFFYFMQLRPDLLPVGDFFTIPFAI